MKIAIISDIHGNFPALEAVMNDIEKEQCTQIFCLGDVCGYYCMINECMTELKKKNVFVLLGNHDYYLRFNQACMRSYTVNQCLDYQKDILTQESWEFLHTFQMKYDHAPISMRHGGWNDPLEEYIHSFDFEKNSIKNVNYYFSGHTHIQLKETYKEKVYVNPGSIGQPRDGDARAAYAIFEDGEVQLKRIEYNIDRIAFEMKKAGFDPRIYQCLYYGQKIGYK